MAVVMAKPVRGMRVRMGRHSSKEASNEALDIASGTYDMGILQPGSLKVYSIKIINF